MDIGHTITCEEDQQLTTPGGFQTQDLLMRRHIVDHNSYDKTLHVVS